MSRLARWQQRAPEEAYLFNQAFIGSLTCEFVKAYVKEREAAPMTLVSIALAAVLHSGTRRKLPNSTVTSLYEWLQNNEDLLVDFSKRTKGLMPYIKEATIFAITRQALLIGDGHSMQLGPTKTTFSPKFLETSTRELTEIVEQTRFLGRWFAKSGSEASIMAAWGVRP